MPQGLMNTALKLESDKNSQYLSFAEEFLKTGLVEFSCGNYTLRFEKKKRYCNLQESPDNGATFELRSSTQLSRWKRGAIHTLIWTFAMSEADCLTRS